MLAANLISWWSYIKSKSRETWSAVIRVRRKQESWGFSIKGPVMWWAARAKAEHKTVLSKCWGRQSKNQTAWTMPYLNGNVGVEDTAVIFAREAWFISWDDEWGKTQSPSLSSLLGAWSSYWFTLSSTSSSAASSFSDVVVCCSYEENVYSQNQFPTLLTTLSLIHLWPSGSTPVI